MARLLGFVVFIYSCALVVHCQNLNILFTIQPGTTNGGCDARTALLNQYATESVDSLVVAIDAISNHGGADTPEGEKVRRALDMFFRTDPSIPKGQADRRTITRNLQAVLTWFRGGFTNIPPGQTFLFCDSSFLVQKAVTDQAQDNQGNGVTQNGQNVPISTAYATKLKGGNVPWWAGEHTTANGYYFTAANSGGNYCNAAGNYGLTSILNLYVADPKNPKGTKPRSIIYQTVVLCPGSFTIPTRPDTWIAGSNQIRAGTSLDQALPKCTTLLHEAFHVVHGTSMLEGDSEFYSLADCTDRSKTKASLKTNPESYVYFISSMYYLFGTPPAIPVNWDFTDMPNSAKLP